ncbi:hypothetical protein K469DRAFT_392071 [Zopfia rhizophila CBS 207.26]|uniref:Uncharacterized protein n=1 Tax=Zopfia rhizophila CBS 207.26 TaxID=1314779 RepID=A0A6A6EGX0_9PEZI|nr:hypothetical protein K469DRAFT_392071 [Zopfia rhizophila CBS 207.26]
MRTNFRVLRPGMSLTMVFVIGQHSYKFSDPGRCPRPGCRSCEFATGDGDERRCKMCDACFGPARTTLPLLQRDDGSISSLEESSNLPGETSLYRKERRVIHQEMKEMMVSAIKSHGEKGYVSKIFDSTELHCLKHRLPNTSGVLRCLAETDIRLLGNPNSLINEHVEYQLSSICYSR